MSEECGQPGDQGEVGHPGGRQMENQHCYDLHPEVDNHLPRVKQQHADQPALG